ncbi:MAG: flagellar hook-associated protein FlgK [Verrucomicrobia bacterium]|nr:flagellar hook-associated protein FlgK [Verrucomicrobiota bacterium]
MPLGLIGSLELAKRSLDTNMRAIELTGHNLANVSNPAYSRQRLKIQTGDTLPDSTGPIGTGSTVSGIEQVRSKLIDTQITTETSVTGFLEGKQKALEFAEVNLGQALDRQSSTAEGATAAQGIGGQQGLVEGFTDFFNALQSLSTSPNSTADRQIVLLEAESLTNKFNALNQRLARLRTDLNTSVKEDVTEVNTLITQIAAISLSVTTAETGDNEGSANDLRDRRQGKLEELAKLVSFQSSEDVTTGTLSLFIGGVEMINADNASNSITTTTDANGGVQVQATSGTALALTGGVIKGTIDARDGDIAKLNSDINTLAGTMITIFNLVHGAGFALDGTTTGQPFFNGTTAADIAVNATIRADPSLIQASANGDTGNNQIALSLASLGQLPQAALGNLTFAESYNQSVANLGQALNNTNTELLDQGAVNQMLLRRRDSLSGVSIDEEMANLIIFQRAFQASARMVQTLDELLQSVISLAR